MGGGCVSERLSMFVRVCAFARAREIPSRSSFKTKYKADAGGSARFDETFDLEKPGARRGILYKQRGG